MADFLEHRARILRQRRLTNAQWYVLYSLADRPLLDAEIVQACCEVSTGGRGPRVTESETLAGIQDCMAASLIFRLTARDCAEDRKRWAMEELEGVSDLAYRPRALEYTRAGCSLYHEVMKSLHGSEFDEAVWLRQYKTPGSIALFAVHMEPLQRELAAWVRTSELRGVRIAVGKVTGPFPVDAFWIDRFTRMRGYRADVDVRGTGST